MFPLTVYVLLFVPFRCSEDILSEMEALKCEKVLADVTRRFKENHVSDGLLAKPASDLISISNCHLWAFL